MKLVVFTVFLVGLFAPSLCRGPIVDLDYYALKHNGAASPFVADSDIIERFFPQRVDHFDPSNLRNYLQRYFSIENYYQIGGPVFIFIGGFQPLDSNSHFNYTHARELAIEHSGMVYALENRFFGLSRPATDLSIESLRLFTIEQSLRDYATLIQFIKSFVASANSFRIFVGGTDTGATLATWLAQAYPDLASGTWASSAALEAGLEFPNYFNDIGNTLKRIDSDCYSRIEEAFTTIEQIFENKTTYILDKLFSLQYPISRHDSRDKNSFFIVMSLYFANLVELFNDETIEVVCNNLIENKNVTALEGFASFIHGLYAEVYPNVTINIKYSSLVRGYSEISWDSAAALGPRQMLYFSCNQFSLFETTRVQPTPFGDNVPLSFYTQFCRDIFSDQFTDEYIATQNLYTTVRYYGKTPFALYVYFTNGGNDPYRLFGLEEDLNILSPTFVIPNHGKSSDFAATSPTDSFELNTARQTLNQLIRSRP